MKMKQLLIGANLLRFLDPHGFTTNVEANAFKPNPRIYLYAAQQMCLPPPQCLYIGEDSAHVEGACAVGMSGIVRDLFLAGAPFVGSTRAEKIFAAPRFY